MLPPIVVQVAPPSSDAALTGTLIEACARVVVEGGCVLGPSEVEARAHATVTFHVEGEVRLQIVVGGAEPVERVLRFREEDEEIERWRAVGLVVGTLAGLGGATESEPDTAAPPLAEAGPEPVPETAPEAPTVAPEPSDAPRGASASPGQPTAPPAAAPPVVVEPRVGWIGALAQIGPGFDAGPWRVGGGLDGGVVVGSVLVIGATVAYTGMLSDLDGVTGSWLFGALGPGVTLDIGDNFAVGGRVDAALQRMNVRVVDAATDESDQGGRWVVGGRALFDVTGYVTRRLGMTVAAEARVLSSATDVSARGRVAATESPLRMSLWAGLRYAF